MARPTKQWAEEDTLPMGFDVVIQAVVGHVEVLPYGEGESPHVAAFRLIAGHDTPGIYTFPMANGQTCRVEVGYEGEVL